MRISYVKIENFRNFKFCEVKLGQNIILVGENKSGKSNFIHALRLVLDPSLSDSECHLTAQDFWDGDGQAPFDGRDITITIQFTDFADDTSPEYLPLSWLSDCLIEPTAQRIAQLTYKFYQDKTDDDGGKFENDDYEFIIYPTDNPQQSFNIKGLRKDIPIYFIKAIRDIASDNKVWQRSPLRRLVSLTDITATQFEPYANEIKTIVYKKVSRYM